MFSRNHRSRVTVARGSALEMEFKRGRSRVFNPLSHPGAAPPPLLEHFIFLSWCICQTLIETYGVPGTGLGPESVVVKEASMALPLGVCYPEETGNKHRILKSRITRHDTG